MIIKLLIKIKKTNFYQEISIVIFIVKSFMSL